MSVFDLIHTIYFSPTGTTRKVAEAIAKGLKAPASEGSEPVVRSLDLTHRDAAEELLAGETLAVLAAPVYGGHVAPEAVRRMKGIRGSGTPAVVAVVYGNRAFEHAAEELARLAEEQGFRPIAAGAFVGEHSYSTPETPIAAGRPDDRDLAAAEAFGEAVRRKIDRGDLTPVDAARLKDGRTPLLSLLRFARFVLRYRRRQKKRPVRYLPEGDAARCTRCGRCAALCPVGAIARGDETRTDPARCIRCCACVKGCPVGARTFRTPFAEALARNFTRRKEPVTRL